MANFLKDSENLADAKVTGVLVLRLKLKDFERLKEQIKIEYPETALIYQRTSCGRLWIKEGEEK